MAPPLHCLCDEGDDHDNAQFAVSKWLPADLLLSSC